QGFCK
ncbi:hypothetical protein D043_1918B, partial [Vibrio parahaemolyticus EKP-021]